MWGHSTLFSSSIISGSPNWLTRFHYFISIHHCFHSKKMAIAQSFIIYAVISFLVHSLTPYSYILWLVKVFFLLLLLYFWLPYCFLMGIRFSKSCVFIFYIVFSFSFCLFQTFVIHRNYLIEKKHGTKTIPVFLPADGEASWLLLPSLISLLSCGTVQPEKTYSCTLKVTGQVWESQKKG